MDPDLPKAISGFLLESIRVLGTTELIVAASTLFLVTAIAVWAVAKLLERNERHAGAAISSGLTLVLIAGFLGASYLALLMKGLLTDGAPPSAGLLYFCAGIGGLLMLVIVHGAFGTVWWKSIVLVVVVGGSAAGAAVAGKQFLAGDRMNRVSVLAAQVAGMKTNEPPMIQSEALKKSAAKRAVRFEREDLKKRHQALIPAYNALVQDRARLNMNDATAVNAFNVRAADYHKEKQFVTTRIAQIEAEFPTPPPTLDEDEDEDK